MKKFTWLLLFFLSVATLQAQDNFSRDVIYLSGEGTITLKSTASSSEKKQAIPMAVKSAIDTYLFAGIQGVDDGKPILKESDRSTHSYYFDRLYENNRYAVFAKPTDSPKPKKNALGLWEVTVTVLLYKDALDRDLLQNNMRQPEASEMSAEEVSDKGINPSIMVVPYKQDNETYKQILSRDSDKRIAISKVQEEFRSIGVTTVDFEAKYNAALRSNEFEYENAGSFDDQLIKSSGADIYVSVDIIKRNTGSKGSVSLTLKAYETATGNLLSSQISNYSGTTSFDRLCVGAIHKVSEEFLAEVVESLAKTIDRGTSVTLRVGIAEGSYRTLNDEVGNDGLFVISDYIRTWIRKNAVGGVFHQQGKTDLSMILDNIQIPNKDENGILQDANDFAVRLTRYLKKLGINASNRLDGNTIYLTIED